MNRSNLILLGKALLITVLTFAIVYFGLSFLILKTVSIPFVPSRNIDEMSDYYTGVWESERGNSVDNSRFTIIDITENSRGEIAEILRVVNDMNPKIIGLDVSFMSKDDEKEDSCLVSAIQNIYNIVLPVEYNKTTKDNEFLYSIFYEQLKDKKYGVVSIPENRDILRTFSPSFYNKERNFDAFSYAIAKTYGAEISNIRDKDKFLINYTTLKLTDEDALQGTQFLDLNSRDSIFLSSEISNRIVLLGSTSHTSDQHLTPLGYNLSGVMIHAHIINSLIENKMITEASPCLCYLICFIIIYIYLKWFDKHKHLKKKKFKLWVRISIFSVIFLISIMLFAVIGTVLFYNYCYYLDFAPFIVAIILTAFFKDLNLNFNKK